jgi:hypothetical protein
MAARLILALGAAAALAGCATVGIGDDDYNRPPEFVGRTMRVETAAGQVSVLRFASDGTVQATFGTRSTQGRWRLEGDDLCFTWAGDFRECWPYEAPFRQGRTTSLTSSRGNVVRVTLL